MKFIKTGMVIVMCLAALFSLFGCQKKPSAPTYPFDTEKAYFHRRDGVIAGGGVSYDFSEEDIVAYYEYPEYPPEEEAGMRDKGADVYFVGLKSGTVTVTITEHYPTCEDESYEFNLVVDENLCVTKQQ